MNVYVDEAIRCKECGKPLSFMIKNRLGTIRCGHQCLVYYNNEEGKLSVWKVIPDAQRN